LHLSGYIAGLTIWNCIATFCFQQTLS